MRIASFSQWLLAAALFFAASGLIVACAGGIKSNLFIEPGKQFVLGGSQPGAFKVQARNVGPVPVEVKERPGGGGIFGKGTLKPGESTTLRFMAGSSALLLNPSGQQAHLQLHITGDTRLGMRNEENGKL